MLKTSRRPVFSLAPVRCWPRLVGAFARDRRGGIAILAALVFPILLGGMSLGAETSYWYMSQRHLQHVADVTAHAATARLRAGDTLAQMKQAATHVAVVSGFDPLKGTLTLNNPPSSGPSKGDAEMVEVRLTHTVPRWLSAIFNATPITLSARTTAGMQGDGFACILALATNVLSAVKIAGATSITLKDCDVASNSVAWNAFDKQGTQSHLETGCIVTVGQATVQGSLKLTRCTKVHENMPRVRDPYAKVPEPAIVGPCDNGKVKDSAIIIPDHQHPSGQPSKRFCNGLRIQGAITFLPGLYIIEGGDFENLGNTTITAAGVTFYIAPTARVRLQNNLVMTLTPPLKELFNGLVFFGSRSATNKQHQISGNVASVIQGAIYFPTTDLEFSGSSAAVGGCTQLIARTVTLIGNSLMKSDCEYLGLKKLFSSELVAIKE